MFAHLTCLCSFEVMLITPRKGVALPIRLHSLLASTLKRPGEAVEPTFSSARESSWRLAFSTSSAGPLIVTASMPEPSVGKWMCTPPHSSMMERTKRPLEPIRELCNLDGMDTSTSVMFAWEGTGLIQNQIWITKVKVLESHHNLETGMLKNIVFVGHDDPFH